MQEVTFIATEQLDEYHGSDSETGSAVDLGHGDSAKVSKEKAEQLLADFPNNFEKGKVADPPPPPPPPDPDPSTQGTPDPNTGNPPPPPTPPTAKELAKDNDRPTLDKLATDAGIADAAALPTKADVAKAIVKQRS
jgi:hypothetical protein